jgi:hypothetical protein
MASNFEAQRGGHVMVMLKEWDRRVEAETYKVSEPSEAQKMLLEAYQAIDNRAAERDTEAERSMKRAVAIFNAFSGRSLTETEGWMFMVCLKMARAKAGKFQRDDYIDMASYAALAGECDAKSV